MKIQRPGNTETHLLYQNYLRYNHPDKYDHDKVCQFVWWLYHSCGLYDHKVSLSDIPSIIESDCYAQWINAYESALRNSLHIDSYIGNPSYRDNPPDHLASYLSQFNANSLSINYDYIYNRQPEVKYNLYWALEERHGEGYHGVFHDHYRLLEGRRVLVVSAFSGLVEYQYNNNTKKLFVNFPDFELTTYTAPYTFMNRGPHANFFETLDMMWDAISRMDFDIALLSCGNYAAMLADRIDSSLHRDAVYMGRGCNYMFGIDPNRDQILYPGWITEIPQQYIPTNFDKVEDGVYWKKVAR